MKVGLIDENFKIKLFKLGGNKINFVRMEIEKLEKFYSKQAKFYDLTRNFFLFNRKEAIDYLDIQPNDVVVDLACGTGLNMPLIIKKQPKEIIGIDYSQSMLAIARRKYPIVKFIEADVANYQFTPNSIDKIICTYSMSMIEEWQKTIQNVANSLKRNGIFVILDFHPWQGFLKIFYPIFRWWLKKHGVYAEKDFVSYLKLYFKEVQKIILNFGYNQIIIAKFPK